MSKIKNINWESAIFLIGYHAILLAVVPLYFFVKLPSLLLIGLSLLTLLLTGLSITAGYHRLFSHQTYKTNRVIEFIMLFFGSMSTQGSALRWSYDHRLHHAHIDKDDDPYSVTKGFWHAHFLWMLKKQRPMDNPKIVADLLRNPLVQFQHKHYGLCMIVSNLIFTTLIGLLTGDFFGAFVISWGIRLFFLHHSTWFINSLCHYWGHQNYSTEHTAVDNYILCFLTFGEGYHNYHHTFANDYRNGIKWYHFDPTKWLIWAMSKLKLAHSLRRSNETRILNLMVQEHKKKLLEKVTASISHSKEELEERVIEITDSLSDKLGKLQKLLSEYRASKKKPGAIKKHVKPLARDISKLKRSLKREMRQWRKFSKTVMRLKAA